MVVKREGGRKGEGKGNMIFGPKWEDLLERVEG